MVCPVRGGSSPLSRGIPHDSMYSLEYLRIIPALAGNTSAYDTSLVPAADHPRSRGEYLTRGVRAPAPGGSSPLSRGILRLPWELRGSGRIIPALAGNTRGHGIGLGAVGSQPGR